MGDNNKEILLTEEGYKKMEAELEKLKTETRAWKRTWYFKECHKKRSIWKN